MWIKNQYFFSFNFFNPIHLRGDVKIPTYKPPTNHKKPSVSSHTLAPTTICDLSHSVGCSPLTDLGHISSVTYVLSSSEVRLWSQKGNFDVSPYLNFLRC